MGDLSDERNELAAAQTALIESLLMKRPFPRDFDGAWLQAAAESLERKRLAVVAKMMPEVARDLGADFQGQFRQYACNAVGLTPCGRQDALAFAAFLLASSELPGERRSIVLGWLMGRRRVAIVRVGSRVRLLIRLPRGKIFCSRGLSRAIK